MYRSTALYERSEVGPEGKPEWGILPDSTRPEGTVAFRESVSGMVSAILSPGDAEQQFEEVLEL